MGREQQRNICQHNISKLDIYTVCRTVRKQSNEITAQAMNVFDTSNLLAINALAAARENVKLYGKAMESIMEYNNNVANAWSSFFTSAQRQQYFRQ